MFRLIAGLPANWYQPHGRHIHLRPAAKPLPAAPHHQTGAPGGIAAGCGCPPAAGSHAPHSPRTYKHYHHNLTGMRGGAADDHG